VNNGDEEKLGALIDGQLPDDEAEALKLRIEDEPELREAFSRLLAATDAVKIYGFAKAADQPVSPAILELLQDDEEVSDGLVVSDPSRGLGRRWRSLQIAAAAAFFAFLGWIAFEVATIRSTLTAYQDSIWSSSDDLPPLAKLAVPIGSSTAIASLPDDDKTQIVKALPERESVGNLRSALTAQNHPALRMAEEFRNPQSDSSQTMVRDELLTVMTKIWGKPVELPNIGGDATFDHGRAVALGGTIMANLSYRVGDQNVDLWIAPSSSARNVDGYYPFDDDGVLIASDDEMIYAIVGSGSEATLQELMSAIVDAP